MQLGQTYLESIETEEMPDWFKHTEALLQAYPEGGQLGITDSHPIPLALQELGIIRIDVESEAVNYVWLGGMDRTTLVLEKLETERYRVTAHYNKEVSKVIWPESPSDRAADLSHSQNA